MSIAAACQRMRKLAIVDQLVCRVLPSKSTTQRRLHWSEMKKCRPQLARRSAMVFATTWASIAAVKIPPLAIADPSECLVALGSPMLRDGSIWSRRAVQVP